MSAAFPKYSHHDGQTEARMLPVLLGVLLFRTPATPYVALPMKAPYVSAPPGPDWSDVCYSDRAVICHERLAIVDVTHRARLVVNKGMGRVLAVNSKIDNHQEMNKERLTRHHDFQTDSDREPILYLYDELGPDFAGRQSGPTEFYAKAFEIAAPKSVG